MKQTFLTLIALFASANFAPAASVSIYSVTWDTSALKEGLYTITPDTTFYFGAQLLAGDGAYESSVVRMTSFNFGSGHALGTPIGYGGLIGDLASGFSLRDSEFFNALLQPFEPGEKLNFTMSVFSKDDGGAFPDAMNFALYSDNALYGLIPIGTFDPLTFSLAARADLPSNTLPKFETFDSFSSMINDNRYIPAPVIRPFNVNPSPVPEPSTFALAATGAALVLVGRLARQFRP